jgi:hypothetical protein
VVTKNVISDHIVGKIDAMEIQQKENIGNIEKPRLI